jgi:hypothetical protein
VILSVDVTDQADVNGEKNVFGNNQLKDNNPS